MDKGWVKLHRSITENHFLMHDNNAFVVFTKMLLMVGKAKGQWSGGRKDLAEYMNMNENTLYSVLKRLEKEQIITRTVNRRYTIYTICNWHNYQHTPQQVDKQSDNNPTTIGQHYNKNKKKNYINTVPEIPLQQDPLPKQVERASRDTVDVLRKQLQEKGIIKRE